MFRSLWLFLFTVALVGTAQRAQFAQNFKREFSRCKVISLFIGKQQGNCFFDSGDCLGFHGGGSYVFDDGSIMRLSSLTVKHYLRFARFVLHSRTTLALAFAVRHDLRLTHAETKTKRRDVYAQDRGASWRSRRTCARSGTYRRTARGNCASCGGCPLGRESGTLDTAQNLGVGFAPIAPAGARQGQESRPLRWESSRERDPA